MKKLNDSLFKEERILSSKDLTAITGGYVTKEIDGSTCDGDTLSTGNDLETGTKNDKAIISRQDAAAVAEINRDTFYS